MFNDRLIAVGPSYRIVVILIALVVTLGSASTAIANNYVFEQDITFGKGADVDLRLDLARPSRGEGPFPALVFVPGGGFGYYPGFSKRAYDKAISKAAENGYVAVTIEHRLLSATENGKRKYPFPSQIYDAKCAVRWLRANAVKYMINANRIGILGVSSGGYIALMVGLTSSTDGLEGQCGNMQLSSSVQAVVNMAGAIETTKVTESDGAYAVMVALLGGTIKEVPDNYKKASLLEYVRKGVPPVLTIIGDLDKSVPLRLSVILDEKFKEVGASHTLIIKKNTTHGESLRFWEDDVVWDFLDVQLKEDAKK